MVDLVRTLFARRKPVTKDLPELASLPGALRIALPVQTRHQVCNPSIMAQPDGSFLCLVRGANYNFDHGHTFFYGSGRTTMPDSQNYLMRLSADLVVRDVIFVEDRHLRGHDAALDGIEDCRLFRWRGADWVLGTARNASANTNVMVLSRLEGHVMADTIFLPSPLGMRIEKNWVPLVLGDELHFIYSHDPLRIFRLSDGSLKPVTQSTSPLLARCSGGSCAQELPGGGWRSVIHRYDGVKDVRWRVYEHMIADYAPDLTLRRISRPFRFEFDGVEFCAGLVQGAGAVVLSYGVRDNKAVLLRLTDQDIEGLF